MHVIIIMASVAIFIISTCGCLGHGLSLRAIIVVSEKKTTFVGLFALMTVADMVILALGSGLQVYELTSPEEHLLPVVQAVMDCVSSIAFMATAGLSVDRYLAVKTNTHFHIWDKPVTMVAIIFIVVTVSCVITPWTSHFTSDPMCGASKSVIASNAFTYLTSVTLVAGTFGVTCSLSRWILKMGARVAAVETRPQQNTYNNKKNQMSSAMAIRWVILVEGLSFACLSSISFIGLIHDKKCASSVSSQWWYRLLQASPKGFKPFLLMFVSRFFRQSVFTTDTNQNTGHNTDRRESIFSSYEESPVHVQSSPRHLNGTCGQEMFPVANSIISLGSNNQSQLKAVAAIQGRPYPFRNEEAVASGHLTAHSSVSPVLNIGDRNPTHFDTTYKPTFSLYELHLLPTQDPIQALVDGSTRRNDQISVRFTCDFQFSPANSCPDLNAAVSNEDTKSSTTRERAQTFSASSSPKTVPGHRPLTDQQLHPNNWSKSSLNLEAGQLERNMNESAACIPATSNNLRGATSPQRWDSMCNLAGKTYSLPFVHLTDSKANTPTSHGCKCDADSCRESSTNQSISDILLIDDKNVSAKVWEPVPLSPISQSEEYSEKTPSIIPDNKVQTVLTERYVDSFEARRASKETVVSLFDSINCDSVFDMEEKNEYKKSVKGFRRRTVCCKNSQGEGVVDMTTKHPRQRHPSAPTTYGEEHPSEACQEGLSRIPSTPGFTMFRRPTLRFPDDSECPPELKLAFCDPQPSHGQSSLKTVGKESESKRPTAPFTDMRFHPDMTDSPRMCIDIRSSFASAQNSQTRKLSVSVYDRDSHVYLGPYVAQPK